MPTTPISLQDWFSYPHLVEMAQRAAYAICIAVFFETLVRIVNWAIGRALRAALARGPEGGEPMARLRRRKTLIGVAQSVARWTLYFIAFVLILNVLGVGWQHLGMLVGTAGIIGLAVGFGSQRLVRDLVTGFFILLEGQFDVGDRVTIGTVTGTVEELGLRIVRVRDDTGRLHLIANGDIVQVCNHSRGPVTAWLDISLPAGQAPDRAIAAISALGEELARERTEIASPARVQGVSSLDGGKTGLRIVMSVPGAKEQELLMELRDRVRRRFQQEGIELA